MRLIGIVFFGAWLAASAAPALAQGAPAPAGPPLRVIESFNVGDDAYVRALAVERPTGALWVGTSKGVHEIDLASGKPRRTFTRASGLANEYVFAIGIDQKGYKWFGTNAGGVSRYKDGKWKTYFPMHGLADYWVYSFANQKNGDLWIGTWAGVNVVDMKNLKWRTYVKELINEWVYGLGVDARDQVWFGTEGGVSMFDGKTWRSWTHKDGLGAGNPNKLMASPNTGLGTRSRHDLGLRTQDGAPTYNPNYVFSILVAADQSIWAGTWGGGVSRFDGKRWTNYTTKEGLAGDIVYSIAQDAKGVLWFGTSAGLSSFDGKRWRKVDKQGGLLDNNVYAVAVAPNGDIWAGTKRGVARLAGSNGN
ncbi:MAG: two-component regulator propeller domain-containing protein [Telluria sp.]|nr:two-component regulator propeller domain-containing protein [Telluria sp.]